MGAVIGGQNAWKTFVEKGILCSLQWVEIPTGVRGEPDQFEPCMVLASAIAKIGRPGYVIPLNNAFWYQDPREAAGRARTIANHIGLGDTSGDAVRVLDVILNHLEELVKMPPAPRNRLQKPIGMGDLTLRANGQAVGTRLITPYGIQ